MSTEGTTVPDESLEPIRKVRSVEGVVEAQLARLREESRAELEALRHESEELVGRARFEAERAREQRLESRRAETEREAERLLAEGRTRAAALHGRTEEELASLRDALLSAILGGFRPTANRSGR